MDKAKQIANKWQMQRYRTPGEIGGMDNQEFYNGMIDDISEFAKQEAIGFADFIRDHPLELQPTSKTNQWMGLDFGKYTTEELYSLYKEQVK